MKQLFPIEIQQNSIQSLWEKRGNRTQIIYLVIILVVIAVSVSLPFVYVDVSAQSRGAVTTLNENNSIVSAIYAEVKAVNLYENKAVHKGDTLIWLNSDELDEQIVRLNEQIALNTSYIHDISDLLVHNNSAVTTQKYRIEYLQFQASMKEKEIAFQQAKQDYERTKQLYDLGAKSKADFLEIESNYYTCQSQKELTAQEEINSWQAEKSSLEDTNNGLISQKKQLQKEKRQYIITAPMSGNIVQYNGIKPGNFIQIGDAAAQISTSDSLLIECYVLPSDIGYINKGQAVDIQVDTYNYQQWGLLKGKVTEILSDVVEVNNSPFFRVRCMTMRNYLSLPNGYKGYLKKGMTLTGRFFLTKRSLAQLLFDKIDNWMNPKQINNGN